MFMVRLAVSVMTDEFSSDIEKVAEYLVSQNVQYVELRGVWKSNIINMNETDLGRLKDILHKFNLKVASISGGLLKAPPPSLGSKSSLNDPKLVDHLIEVAKFLDAPYIRCFGFHGKWPVPPVNEWDSWPIYTEWKTKIADMKSKAAPLGKCFICENEGGLDKSLENMERIGKDNVGPGFGILYDMANVANRYGMQGILTDEWLGRIAKYIKFVHAKGCAQTWLFRHTDLINGPKDICRWPQVVSYLAKMKPSDFVGPTPDPLIFSVETHMGPKNRWNNSVASLQNLLQLIRN